MKNVYLIVLALLMFNCSNDDDTSTDLTQYNANLSVLQNLDNGVAVLDITAEVGVEALYGLEYGGGYIYYVDDTDGSLMIATDYSEIGTKSWGDHFDLTNGDLIGDGQTNTQLLVDGNLNDNSTVPNGLEFGSDDYVFKIVTDLVYRDYDDWFVPSKGSIEAIFNNVHMQGLGNFDETLFYWTSTKVGYHPYVMSFNPNFGGGAFFGSCFDSSAIILVRKHE